MGAQFYKEPKDVLFYHPFERFLAKIFGANSMVMRCKTCKKIPTEQYGDYCEDHIQK